ncbi:MAG: hypothetical protein ACE5Q6_01875 [Dehalococcoidia bacterium]
MSSIRIPLRAFLVLVLLPVIMFGCGGEPRNNNITVENPEVRGLQPVAPNTDVGISVNVQGAIPGTEMGYEWNDVSGKGQILQGQGIAAITYRTPNEPGTYQIQLIVSADGKSLPQRAAFIEVAPAPTPTPMPTEPTSPPPTPTPPPTPEVSIEIPPELFRVQSEGEEFIVELKKYPQIFRPAEKSPGAYDLSGYGLIFQFNLGDETKTGQLFFKDPSWKNLYSCDQRISTGDTVSFAPGNDCIWVEEFKELSNIRAVGAKFFGGVEGVEIVFAGLQPK